ncbi:COMM domain-containing protein 10 [Dermatophagoides farinae]|uniref:COMM domain-containing protein 10 n=1 Tax=Dermatophagoides farinae TaxID=6954 RepID=A0A922KW37_DERFA|nr:probable basic-leucine zipper transcription factor S isoform X1 [Dermatophagoides farinae]KAH9497249.1 COMM domain-containing protein 10 [Dermatophagoides farinae]
MDNNVLNLLLAKYSEHINQLDSNTFQKLFKLVFEHFHHCITINIGRGNQLVSDNNHHNQQQQQQLAFTHSDLTLSTLTTVGVSGDHHHHHHHYNNNDDDDNNNDQLGKLLQNSTLANIDNINIIAKSLLNLYYECARSNAKSRTVKNILTEAGWSEEKQTIFIEHWHQNATEIFDILKTKSFNSSAEYLLKNVDRKIKILTDHSNTSKPKLPLGEINFEFNDSHNLTLNFNHSELLNFYDQIEQIQNKIDKLYK